MKREKAVDVFWKVVAAAILAAIAWGTMTYKPDPDETAHRPPNYRD